MEIDQMRKSSVVTILQKETKSQDDLKFVDNYVATYIPELSKMLKSKFQKEACDKVTLLVTLPLSMCAIDL